VLGAERAGFGLTAAPTRGVPPPEAFADRLASDPGFADEPELDGEAFDSSGYPELRASEEVRAATSSHGDGLLSRLVARRLAARADAEHARERLSSAERAAPLATESTPPNGVGLGAASTARGRLFHCVRADAARVASLVSLSPTDWTFHRRGLLRSALVGAPAGPTLARDAGWLVLALDPCVPWTVQVHDA
jgi:hypothetical protein